VADWVTISALATADGTLVLAGATYGSVRSANRAARVAEQSLLASLRPLLVASKLEDPPQKVGFQDGRMLVVAGSAAAAEAADEAVYLAMSVRNAGSGIAVLHGWRAFPDQHVASGRGRGDHPPLEEFTPLTRDLYVPVGDIGFWQGSFRDPGSEEFSAVKRAVDTRARIIVDVLYGDFEGGQRVISRFLMMPREGGGDGWMATVGRHWNIDRADPR
jgi:hypothetical protein